MRLKAKTGEGHTLHRGSLGQSTKAGCPFIGVEYKWLLGAIIL